MAAALLSTLGLLTHCADNTTGNDTAPVIPGAGGTTAGQGAGGAGGATGAGTGGAVDAGGTNLPAVPGGGTTGSGGSAGATGGLVGAMPDAGGAAAEDAGTADATSGDAQIVTDPGATGTLPTVTDFQKPGPFTPTTGPGPSGYVLFYPKELGKDGVKHPIVSWGPGAVENAGIFSTLLNHLASHGFAVISFDATPQGKELTTAIDWMVAENAKSGGMFYQKLDITKITAGGHSAGSLATFVVGADPRLVTTMHISGGTFDPHTDIKNLHAPALFICGEPGGDGLIFGDVASPNCQIDYDNAAVPVFYGVTKGAAHMTPTDIGDAAIRTHQLGAMVGWLRWQLAGDQNAKKMFVGSACSLCGDTAWSVKKQKNLN
jgi:hypothetical protein